jgi:hypothetical protein
MPLKSIHDRNFGFIKQKKSISEHYTELQTRKTLLIDTLFAMKKISVDLFGAAPYMLLLVLHKDALFHCCKTTLLPQAKHISNMLKQLLDTMDTISEDLKYHFM